MSAFERDEYSLAAQLHGFYKDAGVYEEQGVPEAGKTEAEQIAVLEAQMHDQLLVSENIALVTLLLPEIEITPQQRKEAEAVRANLITHFNKITNNAYSDLRWD